MPSKLICRLFAPSSFSETSMARRFLCSGETIHPKPVSLRTSGSSKPPFKRWTEALDRRPKLKCCTKGFRGKQQMHKFFLFSAASGVTTLDLIDCFLPFPSCEETDQGESLVSSFMSIRSACLRHRERHPTRDRSNSGSRFGWRLRLFSVRRTRRLDVPFVTAGCRVANACERSKAPNGLPGPLRPARRSVLPSSSLVLPSSIQR